MADNVYVYQTLPDGSDVKLGVFLYQNKGRIWYYDADRNRRAVITNRRSTAFLSDE